MPANGRRDLIRRLKVKIDVAKLEWEGIDAIHLIQDTDRLQAIVKREIDFKAKRRPRIP